MANSLAIRVHNVGKQYRLGERVVGGYSTMRDQIASALTSPVRKLFVKGPAGDRRKRSQGEILWALKDVNFDVHSGEVLGIIGRNGAGKSTLLKILTRITEPSVGSIDLWGRVGSLLEVGTGFHKELTGRENVYLNGAILGMKRTEIDARFDEIVDFSEIEKFIDTPVKFYSSGMFVRLAFAVAAHLEPEILLVDEVLAVGDAAFQKKCLNKMEDVGREGRTVLFVSHHMSSITRLCERVICLEEGHIQMDGKARDVVGAYLSSGLGMGPERVFSDPYKAPGSEVVRLRSVRVISEDGEVCDTVDIRQPVGIEMEYDVLGGGHVLYPHFTVHNEEGLWLFVSIDNKPEWRGVPRPAGRYISRGWIPGDLLSEGTMVIGPAIRTEEPYRVHFHERDAVAFHVIENLEGGGARGDHPGRFPGVIRPLLEWETEYYPNGSAHR